MTTFHRSHNSFKYIIHKSHFRNYEIKISTTTNELDVVAYQRTIAMFCKFSLHFNLTVNYDREVESDLRKNDRVRF